MVALLLLCTFVSACGRVGFESTADAATPGDAITTDVPPPPPGVSTIAGGAVFGLQDGPGAQAMFRNPVNLAVGNSGELFVADHSNSAIRRVAPDGTTTTLVANHPQVIGPFGLLVVGDTLYVGTDFGAIVEVDIPTGAVTVRVTGITSVRGMVRLPNNDIVFTSWAGHRIRLLDTANAVTDFAGSGLPGRQDGSGATAQFDSPTDLIAHASGFLVGDLDSDRLRLVATNRDVTTYAGTIQGHQDGDVTVARFDGPGALARASDGTLYVADRFTCTIRRIATDNVVTTIAGIANSCGFADSADPLQAQFFGLEGIDISRDERFLYVADGDTSSGQPYHRIRRLTL